MFGYLESSYGSMEAGIKYKILSEGYDYYLFSNGTYIPKNLVRLDNLEDSLDDYYDFYQMYEDQQ